jgi:hypothetical protein
MADENKNPEVELDTDGVKEETIQIETPENTGSAFEKKEEVDLGYTDVSGTEQKTPEDKTYENERETKLEEKEKPVKETKKEDYNLEDYSEKVQKRIKKLTFQVKEAERREKAALEYAKGIKTKYDTAQADFDAKDTNYLKQYDARVDAERDKAKAALKAAYDSQDTEAKESKKKEDESAPAENADSQPQAKISPKAQQWAEDNEWFGSDRVMTSAAMGIHEELLQEGIDSESDEYYNQINKRMKEYFPQKFARSTTEVETKATPVQNVASVSRRSGGRKSVKLTKSQVVIAKKLGVPLEEYAKYVKEGV